MENLYEEKHNLRGSGKLVALDGPSRQRKRAEC